MVSSGGVRGLLAGGAAAQPSGPGISGAVWLTAFCSARARAHPPIVAEEGYDPVEGIMRSINNALEAAIREAPEQWLWFHNRWKSAKREGLI